MGCVWRVSFTICSLLCYGHLMCKTYLIISMWENIRRDDFLASFMVMIMPDIATDMSRKKKVKQEEYLLNLQIYITLCVSSSGNVGSSRTNQYECWQHKILVNLFPDWAEYIKGWEIHWTIHRCVRDESFLCVGGISLWVDVSLVQSISVRKLWNLWSAE